MYVFAGEFINHKQHIFSDYLACSTKLIEIGRCPTVHYLEMP
jgi:hypothetical protein